MSLIAKRESSVTPVPEGTHFARCVQMIDLGEQYSERYDKWSPKVMIRWELPNERYINEEKELNEPRMLGATYTKSLSENANLLKMLEGWRGKKFTDEELRGFNLSVLIGLPCMVTVTHAQSNGSTYANVNSVAALPKGLEMPPQETESIIFDLDEFDALEHIDRFPEFIRNQIKKSREWQTLHGAAGDLSPEDDGCYGEDMPF